MKQSKVNLKPEHADLENEKNNLINIVSHKLLGPSTIIKWNVEILEKRDDLSKETAGNIEDIKHCNQKLIEFSDLMLKKIRSLRVENLSNEAIVDLTNIIKKFVSTFSKK